MQYKGSILPHCLNIGTSRGCWIACDGGEEASHITSAGKEDQGDSAANTGTPCDSGACVGDGSIRSDSSYSYSFTDGNPTQAGGQIAMDSHGLLSLDPHNGGEYHCPVHIIIVDYTVEPLNKGHFGANSFVPCREVVPISEVK